MNSPAERAYQFVCHVLAASVSDRTTEALDRLLRLGGVDWEHAAAVASAEEVAPALFPALVRAGLIHLVSPDFAYFLEAVNELNGMRNHEFLAETVIVAKVLNRVGIEPVMLKGMAYLIGEYLDQRSRSLIDIDILVSSEDFPAAVKSLRSEGYIPRTAEDPVHHHYCAVSRQVDTPHVELHRRFGTAKQDALLPAASVLRNSKRVNFSGCVIRLPSAEDLLSHIILHAVRTERMRLWIWPRLRPIHDFSVLFQVLKDEVDWHRFRSRFDAHGQGNLLRLFCLTAEQFVGLERLPGISPWNVPIQRCRIAALRSLPLLRFLDPGYLASVAIAPRAERASLYLSAEGGLRQLISLVRPLSIIRNAIRDISDH